MSCRTSPIYKVAALAAALCIALTLVMAAETVAAPIPITRAFNELNKQQHMFRGLSQGEKKHPMDMEHADPEGELLNQEQAGEPLGKDGEDAANAGEAEKEHNKSGEDDDESHHEHHHEHHVHLSPVAIALIAASSLLVGVPSLLLLWEFIAPMFGLAFVPVKAVFMSILAFFGGITGGVGNAIARVKHVWKAAGDAWTEPITPPQAPAPPANVTK